MTDMFFLSILDVSVSCGLIVTLLILFSSFLNKRYAAKWKCLIWIFLAIRLLLPFNIETVRYIGNHITKSADTMQYDAEASGEDKETAAPRRLVVELPSTISAPIASQNADDRGFGFTPLGIMKLIWLAGILGFLGVHIGSYLYYKKQLLKHSVPVKNTAQNRYIFKQIAELYKELQIGRKQKIPVLRSSMSDSPMIIGFFNPSLILPKVDYEKEELYFILKHELIHLKRCDVCRKFLFVTANAFHWFNPLIWFMRREAFVDIELSCDERVVQGEDYNTKKIYTEILYTTLHKKRNRNMLISTQFSGSTQIMKKRFRNLLMKARKRNGSLILVFTIVLTIGAGVLIGCSIQEPNTDGSLTDNESEVAAGENTQNNPNEADADNLNMDNMTVPEPAVDNPVLSNTDALASDDISTTTLTFLLEGEPEEVTAKLYVGNGYSIYIPEESPYSTDDNTPVWESAMPDTWVYAYNDRIRFWIERHENKNIDETEKELVDTQGFIADNDTSSGRVELARQENDLLVRVRLMESADDTWCIFYSYPEEAIEGAGARIPVIIDTFAVTP